MRNNNVILCFFVIFTFCEAAFVNNLIKCGIADSKCQRKLLQSVLSNIGKTGIPEYGIPPTDPYDVKNVSVRVLDLVDFTMTDGVAKGVKNCVVHKLETHVEKEHALMEMTCNMTIKGNYVVDASGPPIKALLGGSTVHGEGFAKIKIEKMRMRFDYHFYVRRINGEIIIDCRYEDLKYNYTLGKVSFASNNLYVGDVETSGPIIALLNENWRFIMMTFGKPFLNKAMDIVYAQTHKFFDVVPTRYYITDDLTPYLKKD